MPAVHTAVFRVRHYECDAYGHLNNANYLRYMQEAAFDASAAVGWGFARYEAEGLMWLAYETEIEYLQPLRYGDLVEVKTWVADWRRVRSLRQYEFRKPGEDALVARAQTEWVLLDAKTVQPATIPPIIVEAYSGGDEMPPAAPRKRKLTPNGEGVERFSHTRLVEWRDLDTAGHANNAVYLNYLEECTLLAGAHFGWPVERSRENGFGIVARKHQIDYRLPALLHDKLEVSTWASDVKNFSAIRHYTIKRESDSALIAKAQTLWVWVDIETGRPMRIPRPFLEDFRANILP